MVLSTRNDSLSEQRHNKGLLVNRMQKLLPPFGIAYLITLYRERDSAFFACSPADVISYGLGTEDPKGDYKDKEQKKERLHYCLLVALCSANPLQESYVL
ncbi:hypothetical protein KSX_70830 [Ktedonospora formicarum]|uniref:Uncharacterized protein n=1 Tax=Ktedonospora formicarum TaxID=2778364 RepID=A0A8J3MXS9_9CHLR|nr:hypothetical protein KSX_70830 [Ktedonospora formicarum]